MPLTQNNLAEVQPKLLAQGLLALRENCVMPKLVNSDFGEMAVQKGESITIPVASAMTAKEVNPSHVPPANDFIAPTSVSIPLNQWWEASFPFTDKEYFEAMNGLIPMQAREAIRTLANKVDGYLLGLYKGLNYYVGVAGTTPFATDAKVAAEARAILSKNLAPMDDRYMVLGVEAEMNALNLPAFQNASWVGDSKAIKDGVIDRRMGMMWHTDQNCPVHTAGTLVAGAISANILVGSPTIKIVDAANAVDLKKGDILIIAGTTYRYSVAQDIAFAAATPTDVPIYGTVMEALVASSSVELVATHAVNLAFHRDCFAFASRPLADSINGLGSMIQSAVDPESGLALRLEISRQNAQTLFKYDILFGAGLVRPGLGCRVLG